MGGKDATEQRVQCTEIFLWLFFFELTLMVLWGKRPGSKDRTQIGQMLDKEEED